MKVSKIIKKNMCTCNKYHFVTYGFIIVASVFAYQAVAQSTTPKSFSDVLDWKMDADNSCHGYYEEMPIDYPFKRAINRSKSPLDIRADHPTFSAKGTSVLKGHVRVTQPNVQVSSERADLIRDPNTHKVNVIHAIGDVRLREPGRLVHGSDAIITLDNKTWDIQQPTYRLVMDKHYQPHIINVKQPYGVYDISGWGHAQHAHKGTDGKIIIRHGTFSTCAPEHADWQLRASTIKLNRQSGRGSSFNNVLYVKNIPVFYLPYANFPIDDRRKTGFLYPTISYSSDDGVDIAEPFYWNIAPNYDATITTHFNQRRGARFDGLFRYLFATPNSSGNVSGIWLPHDRHFASFQQTAANEFPSQSAANQAILADLADDNASRGFIHWDNRTQLFNPHWHSDVDFNYVTDDYLNQDIGINADQADNKQLLQQVRVNYDNVHWHGLLNVQGYQTLHPVNQTPVGNVYTRLPQVAVRGDYPDLPANIHAQLGTDYTFFDITRNPGQQQKPPMGSRYQLNPKISLPLEWGRAAYIKPTIQVDTSFYQLHNNGSATNPNRILPLFDVDAGLVFEREVTTWPYTQTLEPRLFYLLVPYTNQSDIPIFDTGVNTFDINQLTATNRFSGMDRVGDANQLAFMVTTRFLANDSGNEKFTATIGEILYFRDRRVQLCANNSRNCDTLQFDARRNDGTSDVDVLSPIVGGLTYHVTTNLLVGFSSAWSPIQHEFNNTTLSTHYQPDQKHIINLGYSFLRQGDIYPVPVNGKPLPVDDSRNDLHQINVSATWPIWGNWSALGRFNYNISHEYAQDYFYGVQYDTCCWALRFIGSRYQDSFNNNADPRFKQEYYIQFLFKGIGAVGVSDPHNVLRNGLPSYVDPFNRL